MTEQEPDNVVNLFQRRLFNYKLAWDNNDLEWLDVSNKLEPLVKLELVEPPEGVGWLV